MTALSKRSGPLAGLKVLDLTRILAGPSATQLLGDMGADVVKVERPGQGDDTRAWGPPFVMDGDGNKTSESGYYLSANRNKRSLAVDITSAEGQAVLHRLVAKADILVENFKKDGLAKYKLDYPTLAEINPGLIYCSITGFGHTGPNAHRAGYDLMVQGYGGIMSITGPEGGEPYKVGVAISDLMTGMYASTAILAALNHRHASGQGQHIDLSLVDTQVAWLANQGANYLLSGNTPKAMGNAHPNIVPYQVFATAGSHIIIAVGNDRQFGDLVDVLGQPQLASDERYATNTKRLEHREELIDLLAELISTWDRDALLSAFEKKAIPAGPVHDIGEVFATDQVKARDMVISMDYPLAGSGKVDLIGNPIKFSATPVDYHLPPPRCGEHSDEVLADWLDDPE